MDAAVLRSAPPRRGSRYVTVSGFGAYQASVLNEHSPATSLLAVILRHPSGCLVDMAYFESVLGLPRSQIARVLFDLLDQGYVDIGTTPAPLLPMTAWASLSEALHSMARNHRQEFLCLSDPDGIALAHADLSSGHSVPMTSPEEKAFALPRECRLPLHITGWLRPFWLQSQAPLSPRDPNWLALTRALLDCCSPAPQHRPI